MTRYSSNELCVPEQHHIVCCCHMSSHQPVELQSATVARSSLVRLLCPVDAFCRTSSCLGGIARAAKYGAFK